jgi:hypothetical protein
MKKLFKWINKPGGNCPVQAEGYFLGYFFYFRARHQSATIEFYNNREDFEGDIWVESIAHITLKTTEPYEAGWLSKRECTFLVFKGCFLFLFLHK